MTGEKFDQDKGPILRGFCRQFPQALQIIDDGADIDLKAQILATWAGLYSPVILAAIKYPKAANTIAAISKFGAAKYEWGGWLQVEDGISRYTEALVRHLITEGRDEESGFLHIGHAAWNALACVELKIRNEEVVQQKYVRLIIALLTQLEVEETNAV